MAASLFYQKTAKQEMYEWLEIRLKKKRRRKNIKKILVSRSLGRSNLNNPKDQECGKRNETRKVRKIMKSTKKPHKGYNVGVGNSEALSHDDRRPHDASTSSRL